MPLAPPVMSATFPARLMCLSSILTGDSRPRETRRAGPTLRARRVSQRAPTVYTAGRRARPGARTDRCIRDPDRGATMATYVLVHGAYQGGWIWKPVVERLRTAGHQVHAPTLDGCAERHRLVRPGITVATHAQEIAQLLFYEDLARVVLVGTSSGAWSSARRPSWPATASDGSSSSTRWR